MGSVSGPRGVIASVDPGAVRDAGVSAGDAVLAVDGQPVRDVIDWMWLTGEPSFVLTVAAEGSGPRDLRIDRRPGEPLGVTFRDTLFTPVRECVNACSFCFVSGVPAGLRPSLYVRDDDVRLSFLAGNFVTLTNLEDADVRRILGQRLSPLHVSVHAVDPSVRQRLFCAAIEDRALEVLDELLSGGIEVHVQIVLVPGVNDGAVLDETLAYLYARNGVLSVGVVPVGYASSPGRTPAVFGPDSATGVVAQVSGWAARARSERRSGWVYPADEFYLVAGQAVPVPEEYDGFPQFENGIGMTSAFLTELVPVPEAAAATLVTGELFAPVLRAALDDRGLNDVRVLAVRNRLFGGGVNVTGLLGGEDIRSAIVADGASGEYLVPDVVVNSDGLLLDDVRAEDIARGTDARVRIIGSDGCSLIKALTAR